MKTGIRHPNLKYFVSLLFIWSGSSYGQELTFKSKYYEAVDKWVAFSKGGNDLYYIFGFIYIDEQAGFTFHYEGNFEVEDKGIRKLNRKSDAIIKKRLSENTAAVLILDSAQLSDLGVSGAPEWLSHYKKNEGQVSYLKNIGWHYNHVGASKLALQSLLLAYEKEPHFEGLEFELGFAYNAVGQFDKAIEVLEKAIEFSPNNFYLYRELGFSLKNANQIDKAETIYKKGIALSNNEFEKSEMAINMAQSYYLLRNRDKFDEWAKLTRKYADKDSDYRKAVDAWAKQWPTN